MKRHYRGITVEEAFDGSLLLDKLVVEKICVTRHERREHRWRTYQAIVSG